MTGVTGGAEQWTISVPETHPHDQPRGQPLEGLEAFTLRAAFVVCAAFGLVRRSVGEHRRRLGPLGRHRELPYRIRRQLIRRQPKKRSAPKPRRKQIRTQLRRFRGIRPSIPTNPYAVD